MVMSAEALLHEHLELCETVYQHLLTENRFFKESASEGRDAELIERKKLLMTRLDESVASLRGLRERAGDTAALRPHRAAIQQAQKRLMKIILLDRENETLLLKRGAESLPTLNAASRRMAGSLQDVLKAYAGPPAD